MKAYKRELIRAWFPNPRSAGEIDRLSAEIRAVEDPLLRAVKVLAIMVKNAPSYSDSGLPFAVAHQEACALLTELQEAGIDAL